MVVYEDINLTILKHLEGTSELQVLDVGCGSGTFGQLLRKNGNYVEGITISEKEAGIARKKLDNVYVLDVEEDLPSLNGEYDLIIFADILEHLRNPWEVLKKFKPYLKGSGRLIISVPNIATWSIRFGLLLGRFEYRETGLMDVSHLRFFTVKTIKELVEKAGYSISAIDVTPNFCYAFIDVIKFLFNKDKRGGIDHYSVNKSVLNSTSFKCYCRMVRPIEMFFARLWKGMFARQFVIIAEKDQEVLSGYR